MLDDNYRVNFKITTIYYGGIPPLHRGQGDSNKSLHLESTAIKKLKVNN